MSVSGGFGQGAGVSSYPSGPPSYPVQGSSSWNSVGAVPPVVGEKKRKKGFGRRFLLVLIGVLVMALVVVGVVIVFGDRFFDKASYRNGVRVDLTLDLPEFEGSRYVERVSADRLLLVSVNEEKQVQGVYLDLPADAIDLSKQGKQDNQDKQGQQSSQGEDNQSGLGSGTPKVNAVSSASPGVMSSPNVSADSGSAGVKPKVIPVPDLPRCEVKGLRPYRVVDGKPVCNEDEPSRLQVKDVLGLSDVQRQNLGGELIVAGEVDGVRIAYSDPKFLPVFVVGISEDKKLLWSRSYDSAVSVNVIENKVWVATGNRAECLGPATKKDAKADKANGLLDQDPLAFSNYQAYQAYLKLLSDPVAADFNFDVSQVEQVSYEYGLVRIDKTGIPALLVNKHVVGMEVGDIGVVMPYLYRVVDGKVVKADKAFVIGTRRSGGQLGFLQGSKDRDGVIYGRFSGGADGELSFWQVKNDKFLQVDKQGYILGESSKYDAKGVDIKYYPVTDLKPLRQAFRIRDDVIDSIDKKALDGVGKTAKKAEQEIKQAQEKAEQAAKQAHDKAVAEAQKAGKQVFEGEIKIMKNIDFMNTYCPSLGLQQQCSQPYGDCNREYAMLILPRKVDITAHNGDGNGMSTRKENIIGLSGFREAELSKYRQYKNKKVTIAVDKGWWPSDAREPCLQVEFSEVKVIPR